MTSSLRAYSFFREHKVTFLKVRISQISCLNCRLFLRMFLIFFLIKTQYFPGVQNIRIQLILILDQGWNVAFQDTSPRTYFHYHYCAQGQAEQPYMVVPCQTFGLGAELGVKIQYATQWAMPSLEQGCIRPEEGALISSWPQQAAPSCNSHKGAGC